MHIQRVGAGCREVRQGLLGTMHMGLGLLVFTLTTACTAPIQRLPVPPSLTFTVDATSTIPRTTPRDDSLPPAVTSTANDPTLPTAAPQTSTPDSQEPSQNGGGGGEGPFVAGRVRSDSASGGFSALEGASVTTSDGRTAITNADGQFRVNGLPPADGLYHVSAPGYVASTITGLDGTSVLMHLQRTSVVRQRVVPPTETFGQPFAVEGNIIDATGLPAPEVVVTIGDSRGATAYPAVTDDNGRFRIQIQAPGERVENGTLVAYRRDGTQMGFLSGVTITKDSEFIDPIPGGGIDPIALVTTPHRVAITINNPGDATTQVTLSLTLAAGVTLGLPYQGTPIPVPVDPLVKVGVFAEAINATTGTESIYSDTQITLDTSNPTTNVNVAMLDAPNFTGAPTIQTGARIEFLTASPTLSHSLTLSAPDGSPIWQGWSAGNTIQLPPTLPPGAGLYRLQLSCWDDATLSARSIATLRPRPLKVLPLNTTRYRRASRTLSVTRL